VAPDTPEDRRLRAKVSLVEALGSEINVHFALDAEPFAIMDREFEGDDAQARPVDLAGQSIYVGRFSPRARVRMGDEIDIAVDTSRAHFFDPATGLAIG
jgi:multiple sugar transport system ATP-binding protein